MSEAQSRKYLLVIKRNNNDYLPLEWHLTPFYANEDLTTLEGIDAFTSRLTKFDLLTEVMSMNIIDGQERFKDFAIIYNEKGKIRELKEGTIFKGENSVLNDNEFIQYIADNIEDKQLLNHLYNASYSKKQEQSTKEFEFILKNISYFIERGHNAVYAALLTFMKIPYERRRTIIIKTSKYINNQPKKFEHYLSKKDSSFTEGKIA